MCTLRSKVELPFFVQNKSKIVLRHAIKLYGGVDAQIHTSCHKSNPRLSNLQPGHYTDYATRDLNICSLPKNKTIKCFYLRIISTF